jgi:hypothetical protein
VGKAAFVITVLCVGNIESRILYVIIALARIEASLLYWQNSGKLLLLGCSRMIHLVSRRAKYQMSFWYEKKKPQRLIKV